MAKVKGTPQYRMKVVPHRPWRNLFFRLFLTLLVGAALCLTYWYADREAARRGLAPAQAAELRDEVSRLTDENTALRQQLTHAQVNANVDDKATEELRQQLLSRREQIAQLEREVAVYRMMSARASGNPLGISFGKFSITPLAQGEESSRRYHLKLVVQKLAEGEEEFDGALTATVVGRSGGQEQKIPLTQLAVAPQDSPPLGEKIPINLKYFQNVETDLELPEGFEPAALDVHLESNSKRRPLVIEQALEWVKPQ